ncbi:hypothetical protein LCGC14_1438690 [marine sediment metagenome]|uniref:Uncharacterized protein n=1 Tax=marine sediment metagenome TaxID=412755 RepID=A0A0F9JLB7_9ZZZZ
MKHLLTSTIIILIALGLVFSGSMADVRAENDIGTITPRLFQSESELEAWLEPYGIHRGQDCDDAVLELYHDALRDGYILWPAPVYKGKVMGELVIPTKLSGKRHFGLWTWIGNDIYYVDLVLKAPHYVKLKYTWLD